MQSTPLSSAKSSSQQSPNSWAFPSFLPSPTTQGEVPLALVPSPSHASGANSQITMQSPTPTSLTNNNNIHHQLPPNVSVWLEQLRLKQYYSSLFEAYGFDELTTLSVLSEGVLDLMGINKVAHRLLLLQQAEAVIQLLPLL
jgi:SAM domain (Sterile alpha motif)